MKTSPLKHVYSVALILAIVLGPRARAYNSFECLRDLMPLTDRATYSGKRSGVEEPFIVNGKFAVFPEVSNGKVTGFFFYGSKRAAYYDAVDIKGHPRHLGDLAYRKEDGIYDLIAQPEGLETVTVSFLPGFQFVPKKGGGPVMLGASVLPVVGAFVSRPALAKSAYYNPNDVNESDLKNWIFENTSDRKPANVDMVKVNRTMLRLRTVHRLPPDEMLQPLQNELKLRRSWLQSNNLDEKAFKQLSLIMEGSCKE